MNRWKALIALVVVGLIGGTGYVVGSQVQQHDLGLEQALPEAGSESDSQNTLPGIPFSGNAVFRIVGQQGDYVLVVLMIKQGDTWRPAKIQSSASGFEYVAGE
jgi:hypothetical protein